MKSRRIGPLILAVVYKETSVNPGFTRNLPHCYGGLPAKRKLQTCLLVMVSAEFLGRIADPKPHGDSVDEIEICNDQGDIEDILI